MATKKPSAAQIAARKLFAERSRAGALKSGGNRKANPIKAASLSGYVVLFTAKNGERKILGRFETKSVALKNAREYHDISGRDIQVLSAKDYIAGLSGFEKNPLTRVRVKSPSMSTKEAPSKRLVARRKATVKAPAGYYANPVKKVSYKNQAKNLTGESKIAYAIHDRHMPSYNAIAYFADKKSAVETAQEAADRTGKQLTVSRVQIYFGD